MTTDTLGISVTLGCASGDSARLDDVVAQLGREGLQPTILPGLERDVVGLGDAIDRNRAAAVYVLCQSKTLTRRQIIRLSGMFSARRGPSHTLLVIDLEAANTPGVMRSIRGAVGDLTRQGAAARNGPDNANLRDVVGPTNVAAVERPDDPPRRSAAESSGEWKRPQSLDRATESGPAVPQSPRLFADDEIDPGSTFIPPGGPRPAPPPSSDPPEPAQPLFEGVSLVRSGPLNGSSARTRTQEYGAAHASRSSRASVTNPAETRRPSGDAVLEASPAASASDPNATLTGWPQAKPVPRAAPDSQSQDRAAGSGPENLASQTPTLPLPSNGGVPRPQASPVGPPDEVNHHAPRASRPEAPDAPRSSDSSASSWPMQWAGEPRVTDASDDQAANRPSSKPTRKQFVTWFVAGMMTLAAVWSVVASALGDFAPAPPDADETDPRAARSRAPERSAPPPAPAAQGGDVQRIAMALANGDLRALDTLLIAPSSGEHLSFFQADDHCRNGQFARLRGFRLPHSVELGHLAAAGFLGDGRYWSATPGAGSFGDGVQVYDSWVKGLMVTPHDARDVLAICVRTR
ncbi:MAG: hypothetical protein B7733_04780 [Myxococcales bacterium FL481]|nr:MAG: hypothetical protein B7733_04780 [Myxococcales bacterium FL481]